MFYDEIKDFIIDRLPNLEGDSFYGADLAHELTLQENNDGCWYARTNEAIEFIEANALEALRTVAYFNDEYGMQLDVNDYCKLTFFMLYRGVNEVVNSLPFINEHWNDEFTLGADEIEVISEQVRNYSE